MTDDEITERVVSMVEQVEKDEASLHAFSIGEQIAIALVLRRLAQGARLDHLWGD